jgi:phosphoribosylformylglycinamidine (FGAM) synthase PurS component
MKAEKCNQKERKKVFKKVCNKLLLNPLEIGDQLENQSLKHYSSGIIDFQG